jgi:hypothetical protein
VVVVVAVVVLVFVLVCCLLFVVCCCCCRCNTFARPKSYFGALLHHGVILDLMPLGDGRWPSIAHFGLELYYNALLRTTTVVAMGALCDLVSSDLLADEKKVLLL